MEQNLNVEINFFYKMQQSLQSANSDGGFVVIKNETVLGIWLNRLDAIKEGIEAFGITSFLVKDINEDPSKVIYYSRPLMLCHGVSYPS